MIDNGGTTKHRFARVLREHKRADGSTDRYWVLLDRKRKDFQVLKISASYPGAESLVASYVTELNRADEKGSK